MTSPKELIIRWPPPLDLHGYQTLLLIMYVHPGLRHATGAPLGWEGPLNHSFPGERCTGEGEFIAQVTLGGSLQNSLLSGGNSRRQGHKSWVAELSLSWQRKKYTKKKNPKCFLGLKEGHVSVVKEKGKPSYVSTAFSLFISLF